MRCVNWNIQSQATVCVFAESHLAWDAWIEILIFWDNLRHKSHRISHEMRELKYYICIEFVHDDKSHLAWDAWIEISFKNSKAKRFRIASRMRCVNWNLIGKSNTLKLLSHLAWDAWIEIKILRWDHLKIKSHLAWDAWIEIKCRQRYPERNWSHLAWDAWIEIWHC